MFKIVDSKVDFVEIPIKESGIFYIDTLPPTFSEIAQIPNKPKAYTDFDFVVKASDQANRGIGINQSKNITIYADGIEIEKVPICSLDNDEIMNCSVKVSFNNAGIHSYYVDVEDRLGNRNNDSVQFIIGGNSEKNCSELTNGLGMICGGANSYCGYPGVFVSSSDGGTGANDGKIDLGDAKCCTSRYCSSVFSLPKCEDPTWNGVQYDPTFVNCSQDYLAEVENPLYKCCIGTLKFKEYTIGGVTTTPAQFEAYWSRQTSGYFKLKEAAQGDYLYCVAKGPNGDKVDFEIKTPAGKTIKSAQQSTISNGIAAFKITADETGTYVCKAIRGAETKEETIKVTESGKDPTKLPFFGIIQLIISLLLIIIYQSCRVNVKGGKQ